MGQNITLNGTSFATMTTPAPVEEDVPNVIWSLTAAGSAEKATYYGPVRRKRGYRIHLPDAAAETAYDAVIAATSGYAATIALVDHAGTAITVRMLAAKKITLPRGSKFVDIEMLEVLT